MRYQPALLSGMVLAAVTVALSSCGAASDATTAAPAAPASATASAAMDAPQSSAAAADPAIPQITATEADEGNDGDAAKIPQGMTEAQAVAAGMGKDGVPVITVAATDTSCLPDKVTVPAGKVWLKMTSSGKKINELYLESSEADELIEVEHIATGKTGAFRTTVRKGSYLIACEPGMADVQIRTPLTVT